jgi:hypothetical protein
MKIFIFATIFAIAVSGESEIVATIAFNDCAKDQFQCLSGACISKSYVCNGIFDCPNYDDEKNCGKN